MGWSFCPQRSEASLRWVMDTEGKRGCRSALLPFQNSERFLPGEFEPILPISQKIARDIRNRYTIGYPVRANDKGAEHKIRVGGAPHRQGLQPA
jgi:hypothetical protein